MMVDFTTAVEHVELLADQLWTMGVVAIEERQVDSSLVTLRTSMGEDPSVAIASVALEFPNVETKIVGVPRSIADTWRQHATATWVNDTVALVPAWLDAPEASRPIFIEPFDTFGLGNHPTTVLALRLALQFVPDGSDLIDVGCGSGVLAIALARLKSCTASVFDIADSARGAVEANSILNKVEKVHWVDNWQTLRVQALVANILAPVLKAEASDFQTTLSSGGIIVLSGMRTDQVEGVLERFGRCTEINRDELDGWTAVVLQKT